MYLSVHVHVLSVLLRVSTYDSNVSRDVKREGKNVVDRVLNGVSFVTREDPLTTRTCDGWAFSEIMEGSSTNLQIKDWEPILEGAYLLGILWIFGNLGITIYIQDIHSVSGYEKGAVLEIFPRYRAHHILELKVYFHCRLRVRRVYPFDERKAYE